MNATTTTTPTIPVTRTCPWCGTETTQEVPAVVLTRRQEGQPIQVAWPEGTPAEREFLLTGYCPTHMAALFTP